MDSKTQRLVQIIRNSTGYDASFLVMGRNLSEAVKDLRVVICPGLQSTSDYESTRKMLLQGRFGSHISKINDADQRELFEIISSV